MNLFSISQLARFSGIKPHTIRMWEQRYKALTPYRTEGNTRYYDNSQLRRLLNIVSLMNDDYKVSELCIMSDKKIFKLTEEFLNQIYINASSDYASSDYYILQLISAGMSYDENRFDKIFSHCILKYGIKNTYTRVIYPMLVRLGMMWASDEMPPANEHFMSNIIRQKFFTAIDSLPPAISASNSWLLYLPENEFHEIGLLLSYFLIRQTGRKAIYLGVNVPLETLSSAVKETSTGNLVLFLVHNDFREDTQKYLNEVSNRFPGKKIYVAGDGQFLSQLKRPKNMYWLSSVENLEQELREPIV